MNIFIAGGTGEHGRNCFCLDDGKNTYLLDCGIMASDKKNPYPALSNDQIRRLRLVFLTHSHADHTGAIGKIFSEGFNGIIVASQETFLHLKEDCPNKVFLEDWKQVNLDKIFKIDVQYGKSGHCLGSVWLMLNFLEQGKKVLYTGDYCEHAKFYLCDKIRKTTADLAILDCAYGDEILSYKENCEIFVKAVKKYLAQGKKIALPLPKNGRCCEILRLLNDELPKEDRLFFADEYFYTKFSRDELEKDKDWYKESAEKLFRKVKFYAGINCSPKGIIFISEPQLKSRRSSYAARRIVDAGGQVIFTGNIEKNSHAQYFFEKYTQQCKKIVFPIHQNQTDCEKLCAKNNFSKVITFHCESQDYKEKSFDF